MRPASALTEPAPAGSPTTDRPLSIPAAEAWIPRTCFKNGPPGRIGVELELLVAGPNGLDTHYPRHRHPQLITALDNPPGALDARLTVEPGGQVELSSRPKDGLATAVDTLHHDLARVHHRARTCGTRLIGLGVDPVRPPRRITQSPRYLAMENYFGPWGTAGPAMMCSTASVQVNVEAATHAGPGAGAGFDERWDLLEAIGPVLVAAFANSPRRLGRPTGFKSTRQAIWHGLDPARTGVLPRRPDQDVPSAWTRWALDAPLMVVRRENGDWSAPRGLSFRGWLRHGRGAVPDRPPPTRGDLEYHLTTLFPQVRARGHLEVRYLDAQPGCWWIVPVATLSALLDDPAAADRARDVGAPTRGRWLAAARFGMADPQVGRPAVELLALAASVLRRRPDTRRFADQVEAYLDRWTLRGRSPADDPPGHAELGIGAADGCPVDGCDQGLIGSDIWRGSA